MKKRTSYIIMAIILIVSLIIDLVSKSLLAKTLQSGGDITIIPNFFELTYVENTGAGLGIFAGKTILLIVITSVFIMGFILYDIFSHSQSIWYMIGVSLIISGGLGNLIDRIAFGYVRDFISIKWFSFVFNFADLFITIGIICFVIYLLIGIVKDIKDKKEKSKDETDNK